MIEYFENTAWMVKSPLSSLLFKSLEKKSFKSVLGEIRNSCVPSLSNQGSISAQFCAACLGGGLACLAHFSPPAGHLGDGVRFPGGSPQAWEPSPTNESWLLFPDLCPSRNRVARAEICRGEHWLLGLVNREDTRETNSSQILQISDGESDMSRLCSTKVPRAVGGEGLRGSKAR